MKQVLFILSIIFLPSLAWACGPWVTPTYPLDFLVTGAVAGAVTLLVLRRHEPTIGRSQQLLLIGAWALLSVFVGGVFANEIANDLGVFARLSFWLFVFSTLSVFTDPAGRLGKLLLSGVVVGGIFFSVVLFMQTEEANSHAAVKFDTHERIESQVTF